MLLGEAERLQQAGRDADEADQQSEDDHIAQHRLVRLLPLVFGIDLRADSLRGSRNRVGPDLGRSGPTQPDHLATLCTVTGVSQQTSGLHSHKTLAFSEKER